MLGLVDFLHFGEFRQLLQRFADDTAFHLPDRDMHPDEGAGDQQEQQHEATGPKAGQVDKRTERDREHEAAETADHAHHAADSADIVRIVDRDVLEDGGLAESHEEAQHEDRDDERHQPRLHVEADRARDRPHGIVGRWIGQHEGAGDRDQEGPVQHAACAIAVRKMAAIGAEHAGGKREHRRRHAGGLDVDVVDLDEILRQPQRQRDESAEHEEIVQRKTPHLDVLQGFEFQPRAFRLLVLLAPRPDDGIFLGEDPEDDAHQADDQCPDLGDGLPAIGDQHERRDEFGNGCADIAGAEDAERGALLAGLVEARNVGDADSERTAGDADEERRDQEFGIGVRPGQQVGCDRRGEHDDGVDAPAAILVGPDAEHQADQRSATGSGCRSGGRTGCR